MATKKNRDKRKWDRAKNNAKLLYLLKSGAVNPEHRYLQHMENRWKNVGKRGERSSSRDLLTTNYGHRPKTCFNMYTSINHSKAQKIER